MQLLPEASKICPRCGKPGGFYRNKAKADGLQSICKICSKGAVAKSYQNHQAKADARVVKRRLVIYRFTLDYLLEHPCVDCGEDDPLVLDFDHIHRTIKSKNLSEMSNCSLQTVQTEIDKCEVRCANCHRRKTAKQLNLTRWQLLNKGPWDQQQSNRLLSG